MRSSASSDVTVAPRRFRDRSLHEYRPTSTSAERALEETRRLVEGEIANLVLAGPTGVGKTHLAAAAVNAIARRLMEERATAIAEAELVEPYVHPRTAPGPEWLNVADTIVRMRLEMDRPLDDRDATTVILRMHEYRGVLVLDDLGREKTSDWTGEVIYALVNARYEALLRTVVTTNLTSAELAESPYWPAISRLAEDGALVRIDAPDQRLVR